jgi:hypothetical protein
MTDTKSASPSDAPREPTKVVVEAVPSTREWIHKTKKMQPGDRAEVTLAQAAKLEKDGVARMVRDGSATKPVTT